MKRNTQMRMKKLIMLGVLSGVVWGSAFAAEPTMPPAATPMPTVQKEATVPGQPPMNGVNNHNMVNDNGENSFTYYDQLQQRKQMARSQSQANAAIFLNTVAPDVKVAEEGRRRHQEYTRETNRNEPKAPYQEQSERKGSNQFQRGTHHQVEPQQGFHHVGDSKRMPNQGGRGQFAPSDNWQKMDSKESSRLDQRRPMRKHEGQAPQESNGKMPSKGQDFNGQPPMRPNGDMPPQGQGFDGQPPMRPNGDMPPQGQDFDGQPPIRPNGNMPPQGQDFDGQPPMRPNSQQQGPMMPPEPPPHMQGSNHHKKMPAEKSHEAPKDSKAPNMGDYDF
ncbi:hypothetical protein [uncultured Veillonella sp.]|uniref:hypothetical protein n=1 Tax=uncultured Veillonella sp. TaxID=159268 RepID=UPI0025F1B61D|nr:hypothetical protein [uncultured Veillonella sp.]